MYFLSFFPHRIFLLPTLRSLDNTNNAYKHATDRLYSFHYSVLVLLKELKKFYTIITAEIVTVFLTKLRCCISFTKPYKKQVILLKDIAVFFDFTKKKKILNSYFIKILSARYSIINRSAKD